MQGLRKFRVACLQLTSGDNLQKNIEKTCELIRQARGAGADFILTPENTGMMSAESLTGGMFNLERVPFETDHPALEAFRKEATSTGAWLLIGSLGVRIPADNHRMVNRSYLISPSVPASDPRAVAQKLGTIVSFYDKIHMFDVPSLNLAANESYKESQRVRPGQLAVLADTPWGKVGQTICYDVRFPQLYRDLASAGASFLTVPAAFTRITGAAHWHVLLRARAIETGCFVFAPAQCGVHPGGRTTYGHSLIIDPWGTILADKGPDDVGFITADIDPALVASTRTRVPSLSHTRSYTVQQVAMADQQDATKDHRSKL